MDKYPAPDISFGVELEMNVAILKTLHKAFVESGDGLALGSSHSSSGSTDEHSESESSSDGECKKYRAGKSCNDHVIKL
jgi:hypothetical protein